MRSLFIRSTCVVMLSGALSTAAAAQQAAPQVSNAPAAVTRADVPPDYVIGPEDVLTVVFWGEKELSGDVTVRPDGKVSLPLINDVQAAGYTPEQLTDVLVKAAAKYVAQPNATVVVKAIHSRKVFVVGQVAKPGAFLLTGDMTVLQLIAQAGDILEYAKAKDIVVVRKEQGREHRYKFNYKDVLKGKNLYQNIQLKPGDTVIVP